MDFKEDWDQNLFLLKFAYDNSYQEAFKMVPYNALHEHQCVTPHSWVDKAYEVVTSLEIIT